MADHGQLIWCDVSVFRPTVLRMFYADVFGWHYSNTSDYAAGWMGPSQICGLYAMPDKFQDMGMPPFWMSYIGTKDIDATCQRAKDLGGTVELGPETFDDHGRIALIRDPLGAGFTAYEGTRDVPTNFQPGHRMGHGLFISDPAAVIPFYETLFDWTFDPISDGPIAVRQNQQIVFYCHKILKTPLTGKDQYWMVYFDTDDLDRIQSAIERNGGRLLAQTDLPEGKAIFAADPDGAVFVLVDRNAGSANWVDRLFDVGDLAWLIS